MTLLLPNITFPARREINLQWLCFPEAYTYVSVTRVPWEVSSKIYREGPQVDPFQVAPIEELRFEKKSVRVVSAACVWRR